MPGGTSSAGRLRHRDHLLKWAHHPIVIDQTRRVNPRYLAEMSGTTMSDASEADEVTEEQFVVVLQTYRTFTDVTIPGSRMARAGCKHLAWISPQGLEFLTKYPKAATVCEDCQPDPKVLTAQYRIPGAREAAIAALGEGDEYVRRFDAMLKRRNIGEWPGA